jgi:hypothetical protein
VLEGAWALVLLHDYHHHRDFADERLEWRTQLAPITANNSERYVRLIENSQNWHLVDFRVFSKAHNSSLAKYDFTIGHFMKQLGSPDTEAP